MAFTQLILKKILTATKFDDITYDEVLKRGLKVMDLTATCMCKENNLAYRRI